MNTYIALLRGVNVGGNNRLQMKDLIHVLGNHNYQNVRTYIQSGNIVFESTSPAEASIEKIIEVRFGFKPEVLILTRQELEEIARSNPYRQIEGKFCHLYFSSQSLAQTDTRQLELLKDTSEQYTIAGKVLYLYAPNGIGRSKLAARVEHCLKVVVTARNLNTVNKLLEMSI